MNQSKQINHSSRMLRTDTPRARLCKTLFIQNQYGQATTSSNIRFLLPAPIIPASYVKLVQSNYCFLLLRVFPEQYGLH
jgi:hypothetical protein